MEILTELSSSTTSIIVTLLIVLVTLYSVRIWRHFTLLRRYGIPGPTPWPFLGNTPDLFRKGGDVAINEWINKYGKIFGFYTGSIPNLMIADPKVLKTVLIEDFSLFMNRQSFYPIPKLFQHALAFMRDSEWKQARKVMTPVFSSGKLKQFVPLLNTTSETLGNHLSKRIGEDVDIKKYFGNFTMDSIASTAFGIDIDSQTQAKDPFVVNAIHVLESFTSPTLLTFLAHSLPGLKQVLRIFGYESDLNNAVKFYERTGQMLIDKRRQQKMDRVDLIQSLLEAELDNSHPEESDKITIYKMSDFDISAQAFLFFVAAYETTGTMLQYAAYVLAMNPDLDRKVCKEIDQYIGSGTPTYDSVGSLTYMGMFVDEVLRFYPPNLRIYRLVEQDTVICGMTVPKGTTLHVPVYHIHHNPEYYPDPETFNPERFSAENKAGEYTDGLTYVPFGAGPRHCIGMRLALLEAKLALVYVLRKVRFVKCDKTPDPLGFTHFGVLRPKKTIYLRVEKR